LINEINREIDSEAFIKVENDLQHVQTSKLHPH
jgi:hypothetical protein